MVNKMYDVNKLLSIANNEVGYLEKASNSQLDDKTANAGDKNFTKYGLHRGCNGQPWCDAFVDDCFIMAYGTDAAKTLLGGFSNYTPTSAQYFKKMLAWYTVPKVGDVVFFKNSTRICHTGIVEKVTATHVYTIEGNTSNKEGLVANGGCVAKKQYRHSYTRIAGYGRPAFDPVNTAIDNAPEIKMGDFNVWVRKLQTKLNQTGYKLTVDGDFGNNTKNALIAFQAEKGLVKDGICGPKTWAKIL